MYDCSSIRASIVCPRDRSVNHFSRPGRFAIDESKLLYSIWFISQQQVSIPNKQSTDGLVCTLWPGDESSKHSAAPTSGPRDRPHQPMGWVAFRAARIDE
jgi:hypothetical protein